MPAARLCIDLRVAASLTRPAPVPDVTCEQTVIYFGCLVVAVILHEISHGVVALWFGDRTAQGGGPAHAEPHPAHRPVRLDHPARRWARSPGIPILAWAKPVPVNPARMRNPRRDMRLREPGRSGHQLRR